MVKKPISKKSNKKDPDGMELLFEGRKGGKMSDGVWLDIESGEFLSKRPKGRKTVKLTDGEKAAFDSYVAESVKGMRGGVWPSIDSDEYKVGEKICKELARTTSAESSFQNQKQLIDLVLREEAGELYNDEEEDEDE
ncbi:MAG: hypothetical protein WA666_11845 [Nitrospirota bacterium]